MPRGNSARNATRARRGSLSCHAYIDSLNELAVFLWLARRKDVAATAAAIAEGVSIDVDAAISALERLTEAGLLTKHAATALFQYALALAPPEDLMDRLCAEYGER